LSIYTYQATMKDYFGSLFFDYKLGIQYNVYTLLNIKEVIQWTGKFVKKTKTP